MILISLHPFAFKKIALLAAAILGLSSVACFADPILLARRYAPAERHPGATASEWSSQGTVTFGAPSVLGDGNSENHEAEKKVFEIESFVGTPVVTQDSHVRACVRHTEAAMVLGTFSA
jgi:hypothetical protein